MTRIVPNASRLDDGVGAAPAPFRRACRRQGRRVSRRGPCWVRFLDAGTGKMRDVLAQTVNISPTGVGLQCPAQIELGASVEVVLPKAHGDANQFHGEVMQVRRVASGTYEIGVQFDSGAQATAGWGSGGAMSTGPAS